MELVVHRMARRQTTRPPDAHAGVPDDTDDRTAGVVGTIDFDRHSHPPRRVRCSPRRRCFAQSVTAVSESACAGASKSFAKNLGDFSSSPKVAK